MTLWCRKARAQSPHAVGRGPVSTFPVCPAVSVTARLGMPGLGDRAEPGARPAVLSPAPSSGTSMCRRPGWTDARVPCPIVQAVSICTMTMG